MTAPRQRPALSTKLTAGEVRRWYWMKHELLAFASELGLHDAHGLGKMQLTDRICAALDGAPMQPKQEAGAGIVAPARGIKSVSNKRNVSRASGRLTNDLLIPGPPCMGTRVRDFMRSQIGPDFHFNGHMRTYLVQNAGVHTLGDAVVHYHATKHIKPKAIAPQFEYNRFSRAWKEGKMRAVDEYTGLTLREAWARYKEAPVDARPTW